VSRAEGSGSRTGAAVALAARIGRLESEGAFDVLVQARALEAAGRDVIHLEIGEPDFPTPAFIREAAVRALEEGHTRYGPPAGLPELREAIAEVVAARCGVPVHPEEVVVTPGAKPIMFFAALALVEPGREVIYPDPGFPIYRSVAAFAGGRPVPVPLREAQGFAFDLDALAAAVNPRTALLILNSPQNPTGGVLGLEDLEAIAEITGRHGVPVLADEVYHRFLYEGEHRSILSLPGLKERVILLDGFSKTYAMTGWRLGFGVMPRPWAEAMARLMVNSNSCTATFTQRAGLAALTGDQEPVAAMVAAFRRRRDLVVAGLNGIPGVRCLAPRGAFYAFPNVSGLGRPAQALADFLLHEAGVALLSGTAFGANGEGYLRLSYAAGEDRLREALRRMRDALAVL
jgi:aspartate/methionine/tyrosine aminotransferase